MSMVFQKFALFPHKTVLQNVGYGLAIQNISKDEWSEKAQKWIKRVGLDGYETYYPGQLSGGMQQRVGLARALATDAEILLMDEAFSALDPLIRSEMQNILLDLQSELHKTIIFITHDLDEALKIGDRIAILRDGSMVQDSDPQEIIMNPADKYVSDFIKDINRARVIQAKSIMTPTNSKSTGATVKEDMVFKKTYDDFSEIIIDELNKNSVKTSENDIKYLSIMITNMCNSHYFNKDTWNNIFNKYQNVSSGDKLNKIIDNVFEFSKSSFIIKEDIFEDTEDGDTCYHFNMTILDIDLDD